MDTEKLVELGLTKREARAYLALLELEQAKAGDIAKRTKEDRTNIYDSLRGLIKKGLVNYIITNNKTYYRIAPPEKLRDYLVEREKSLQDIMPNLTKIYRSFKPKPIIETYEGKEGLKTVLNDILHEGKDFVGFGATDRMYHLLPEYTKKYLREREVKKIHARQFYTKGEKILESKYSVFKSIPKEFSGPATTLIYGDKVAILLWFIEPPVIVLIKSKEAAKAYRNQFEFMWKIVK
ncbi:TPA: TrmB family transcriptional regulator [Candidatus Woesearchaeota archaeon]|nr:helix-turn-helix domain-containing protein [Candidatus Woesearchaeota archaeon]HIH31319.1 TrmB family transcriptional regulator [Candidatus Woesearchaeota archaeon]HIH55390.1 TrmB family transcriptional regulator [Candidatus Woesearchaeota archaeon]HIJ01582.1 TrmB family transcriptional regulator [Candidatus Woesearchaeota archaeon]HIJ14581.1 TrmB family transcriptional regulator [Candidatus Woesearchaeota archaeon]